MFIRQTDQHRGFTRSSARVKPYQFQTFAGGNLTRIHQRWLLHMSHVHVSQSHVSHRERMSYYSTNGGHGHVPHRPMGVIDEWPTLHMFASIDLNLRSTCLSVHLWTRDSRHTSLLSCCLSRRGTLKHLPSMDLAGGAKSLDEGWYSCTAAFDCLPLSHSPG